MKKIEFVYREILYHCLEKRNNTLTQLAISKKLSISLSTVNHALKPLRNMGAVEVKLRDFTVIDIPKIIYHWASVRNVKKDIIYQTRIEKPVKRIESEMPAEIIWGAYSAHKYKFEDVPADYSEVYIYGDEDEMKKRFPEKKNRPNLFVLKKDQFMERYGKTTTLAQTFVDLWNLEEWYAKDFLVSLRKKIEESI